MPREGGETLGAMANGRPLDDTIGETGEGLPDEAVGPGELSGEERAALGDSDQARAIARKLRAEVEARATGSEPAGDAGPDPTGHA